MALQLLFLALSVVSTTGHSGVYFIPDNEIYGAYGSWVITFSMDLAPFKEQLNRVYKEVTQFETVIAKVNSKEHLKTLPESFQKQYSILANGTAALMDAEIKMFYHEYSNIRREWQSIEVLMYNRVTKARPKQGRKRTHRSLLPWIGSILSSLFGTATNANLREVKRALTKLADGQSNVVHALQTSLTLLNKTTAAVSQNRKAINQLANVTDRLETFIQDLKYKFLDMQPTVVFNSLQSKLHHLFHLVASTLRQSRWDLAAMRNQLYLVNQGQFPFSLIAPKQFVSVLSKIQSKVPKGYKLPREVKKDLSWYYRTLPAMLIPEGSRFHVVTVVPLVLEEANFTLFKILSLPVHNKN